ncbi:MAG: hypothetical protein A2068_03285 [Ignavibacteria bacterium GWB2_35_6b]|nr:MAG: hypothetical protein A2068_03285 [Ignavibacteria bacterium GWB2_35_6b]
MGKEFYKNAHAYDIAFNDREFNKECDFLEWALNKHGKVKTKKNDKKSFIELACGPARHAREMAKRGWKSSALDLSEEMVKYAKLESEREGFKITAIEADMTKFKLKKPVTLACTLMESISHLVTNEQMISHFKSVAKNLVSGGIYVIEATHPMFYFPDDEPNSWITQEGNMTVELTFGLPSDKYNSVTQQWHVTSIMKINETGEPERISETHSVVRWYLAQEIKALIDLSGAFEKYWFYGSLYTIPGKEFDDSENSDAMVIVLRKK